jgi:putative membrane protein
MTSKRFPRRVFSVGNEPDPRFSLANERTFLAWIRTSLALMLAGVALEALDAPIQSQIRLASALLFIALGLLATVHAWTSWASTERSMRSARALPGFAVSAIITGGAAIAITAVFVGSVIV